MNVVVSNDVAIVAAAESVADGVGAATIEMCGNLCRGEGKE